MKLTEEQQNEMTKIRITGQPNAPSNQALSDYLLPVHVVPACARVTAEEALDMVACYEKHKVGGNQGVAMTVAANRMLAARRALYAPAVSLPQVRAAAAVRKELMDWTGLRPGAYDEGMIDRIVSAVATEMREGGAE